MQNLPQPPSPFIGRKSKILRQLAVPDAEYSDASPKGSVDEGIRQLLGEINATDGFVTTSSCAGRVSVFLEGRKKTTALLAGTRGSGDDVEIDGRVASTADDGSARQVAGVGGKGAGGAWLFVSHDPVDEGEESMQRFAEQLSFTKDGDDANTQPTVVSGQRFIHFKFEPMVSSSPRIPCPSTYCCCCCCIPVSVFEQIPLHIKPLRLFRTETIY
jgi:tRNA wybutosine-synthesizing protein 3